MKKYFFLLLSVWFGQVIYSQAMNSVVLVEVQFNVSSKLAFRNMGSFFKENLPESFLGEYYINLAENGLRQNGFFVELAGKTYLVTVAQSVRPATSLKLTWRQPRTMAVNSIEAIPTYFDGLTDLAFIRVPELNSGTPFQISDQLPDDGAEIWTVGFQDLLGEPQLETLRGIVSNRELSLPELEMDRKTTYIQHTVVVSDIGAGSPLILGRPGGQNMVIGINIQLPIVRNNTSVAIPGKTILGALNRFQDFMVNSNSQVILEERVQAFGRFIQSPSWDEKAYRLFLPPDDLMNEGWEALQGIFKDSGRQNDDEWLDRIVKNPIDVLRQALSWKLYQAAKGDQQFQEPKISLVSETSATSTMQRGDFQPTQTWRYLRGEWYLSQVPVLIQPLAPSQPVEPSLIQWAGTYSTSGIGLEIGLGLPPQGQMASSLHLVSGTHLSFNLRGMPLLHLAFQVTGSRFGITKGSSLYDYATGALNNFYLPAADIPRTLDVLHVGFGPRLFLPFKISDQYWGMFLGVSAMFNIWSPVRILEYGDLFGNIGNIWPFSTLGFFPEIGVETELFRHQVFGIRGFRVYNYPIGEPDAFLEEQSTSFSLYYRYIF